MPVDIIVTQRQVAAAGRFRFGRHKLIHVKTATHRKREAYAFLFQPMEYSMADTPTKLPVKTDEKTPAPAAFGWPSVDALRREIDHLFDDFGRGTWLRPFQSAALDPIFRRGFSLNAPAVDVLEKDTAFELTAELPGIEAKDVDVSVKDGNLVIRGEKKSEKEEKSKDYYLHERQYGAFERSFAMPKGIDPSAVEARFNNGVLTVTMPKTMEARKPATKIEVKAA